MKLIIGNKAYSSWSLRGWLACKLSGLPFEEVVVPMYDADWDRRRQGDEFAPSSGKVPILWDGEAVVWDSLAIVDYLADKLADQGVGRERFWPADEAPRAMARSMAAEMHSSFAALRREHSMNIRQRFPARPVSGEVAGDLARLYELWAQARARWGSGGPFLFGTFSAADAMFAPVCTRIATYQLPAPRFAIAYVDAVLNHPWMQDWIASAQSEEWIIDRYELPAAG